MNYKEFSEEYQRLSHAIQSGVMQMLSADGDNISAHKHLRVGINTGKCEHAALVGLLISYNIISEDAYYQSVLMKLEEEKISYEDKLSKKYQTNVELK